MIHQTIMKLSTSTTVVTTATTTTITKDEIAVNCQSETNKICYFCGSTKHASSDCPMYA
jgi:hypothetical protein